MLVFEREINNGIQKVYRFDNGYGASIVKHYFSYGGDKNLWELAVLFFEDENDYNYNITYNTPITSDVMGYLTWVEVEIILDKIKNLNEEGQ